MKAGMRGLMAFVSTRETTKKRANKYGGWIWYTKALLQKYSTYQRREGAWCRDRDIDEERFLQDTRSWANHWEAFRKLLERPWFRRRWIIQEAVLAKSPVISCGDRVLSWCDLAQVSELLLKASKSGFFDPVSQELHATIHLVSSNHDIRTFVEEDRQSPELALHQMCARFFSSRCYDPRDIVYSLLSLIHDSDRQRIIPDYSSNTKVEDVFVQCFRIIVDNAQSLNFIFRAKHPPTEDLTGAETWLPCLGAYSREGSCRCGEHGTAEGIYKSLPRPEFRASLSTTPEYCIEKTDGKYTLVASGHLYCPIFYVGNGKAELNEDADFAVFLDQIDAEKEIAQFNGTWKDISPRIDHLPLTAGQWAAFSNGPAQKGDIICVLLGCSSPAILRPFAPGIPEYYLISAQQVNGIMQGEFMDLCIKKDITPQKFRIR